MNRAIINQTQLISGDPIDLAPSANAPGFGLAGYVLTDPDVYDRDLEPVFRRHWPCIAHESAIAAWHDVALFDPGGEQVILMRDGNGQLDALFNLCRQKSACACAEQEGNARSFTCPCHAWTYAGEAASRLAQTCVSDLSRLVNADALEGRDDDLDQLTGPRRVTLDEDNSIIESIAHWVRSYFFLPGSIAPMEAQTHRYISWYLS